MSEVLKLRKSSDNPTEVMGIIDRMNNLEHSNGMFMERFPASVKSWYLKFLNAKYHAPTAFELAKYAGDSDLEELLKFISGERRHPETQFPEYENMEKQAPEREIGPEVNWLALGYPYQHGKSRPDKDDPEVQEGLESLRSMGASRRDRM
jgi:hypothetical protein